MGTLIATNAILVHGMRYIRDKNPDYDPMTFALSDDDQSSKKVGRGIGMVNVVNDPNAALARSSFGESTVERKSPPDQNTPHHIIR